MSKQHHVSILNAQLNKIHKNTPLNKDCCHCITVCCSSGKFKSLRNDHFRLHVQKVMRVMKYCFFLSKKMKMRAVSLSEEIETGARVGQRTCGNDLYT